jgi:Tfp pilus assembly protein PilP
MQYRHALVSLVMLSVAACGGAPAHKPPPRGGGHRAPATPAVAGAAATAVADEGMSNVVKNADWDKLKEHFFVFADTPLPSVKNAFASQLNKYMKQIEIPEQDDSNLKQEVDLLPMEKFPPEDYKLIMIISGTEVAKAIVLDPDGIPHVLRKDARIGNRNGVVAEITEYAIIVQEPYAEFPVVLDIKPSHADWLEKYTFN